MLPLASQNMQLAISAPLFATNYLLESAYKSETHNPDPAPHQIPSPQLRNLYQANEVRPIAVAQVLARQSVSSVASFALQFGDSTDAARTKFSTDATLQDLWSEPGLARDSEIATYLAGQNDANLEVVIYSEQIRDRALKD